MKVRSYLKMEIKQVLDNVPEPVSILISEGIYFWE